MGRNRFLRFAVSRIFLFVFALPVAGRGQAADSPDQLTVANLMQQIKELQQHDRELMERISILEGNQKASTTTQESPVTQTLPPTQTAAAPPSTDLHNLSGIRWRSFVELDYKVLDQRTPELGTYGFQPGSAANFYTGDFDLFLTSRLSEKASALAEINFEEGDSQSFKVDLRRLFLKYDANDHFRLSLGRYQTNIGYYNWAFRSATWLQTTADRPLIMEFASNGGLLPTQAVGLSATGSIPSGRLGLNYVAEYGSSDTTRPDINGDGLVNDENNGNQVNLGLFITPDRFPGLRVGGSIYHDQISDQVSLAAGGEVIGPPSSARWNQTIVNGHLVYLGRGIEFLNEGFLIRHAPIGLGETFNTSAFYSQFSKKVGPVRPYARWQYINASPRNVIFNDIGLRFGPSFGARYDLNESCAFKAQVDRTVRRGMPAINGLHLQLTGTF